MNSKEDIRPISYIKSHAAEILKQVNNTHRPIYITQNGEATAVLIDTESFEKMQKTLGILKILAMGEKDVERGNVIDQSKLFSDIEKKYFKNAK
ncbi:MAG: type II toxin-antitoxin system Phd/YefM family antitoxin [Leptospirales bacterium]